MGENVESGGTIRFNYGRGERPKASENEKKEIEEAYARADERKQREKRNRQILWTIAGIIILIVIGIVGYILLK